MLRKLSSRLSLEASLFGLVTSVSLLLAGGHSTSIDEETYLASLRAFLHGQSSIDLNSVTPGTMVAMPGKSGVLTSFYGFGTTLFNLPMYAIGKVFASLVGSGSQEQVLRLFLYSTNSIALGVTALFIFRICRMLGVASAHAVWASLTFAFCSYALPMAGGGFSEPLTSMFLIMAIHSTIARDETPRRFVILGLLSGCAVLMRSSALLFVPLIALYLIVSVRPGHRVKSLLLAAAGGAAPMVVFLGVNYWRFGSVLKTGYPSMSYDTPLYEGLFGLFLSSGKGLVWFAPMTLVAILTVRSSFRSDRSTVLLLWGCVLANASFFGRFVIWSGDSTFGPRYMMIVLPLIAVLAGLGASNLPRLGLIANSAFGLIAALGGKLVYFNAANQERITDLVTTIGPSATKPDGSFNDEAIRQALWFRPRLSQLVYHFSRIDDAVTGTWRMARGSNSPNIFKDGNGPAIGWYSKSIRLDLWWTYLLETSVPRAFLLGVPVLSAVTVVCLVSLVRLLSRPGTA